MNRKIAELDEQSADPEFWNDAAKSAVVLKEKAKLTRMVESFAGLVTAFEDAETMLELAKEMEDEDSMAEGETMLGELLPRVRQFELEQMLSGEADDCDAILEINSGAGGTDASDWAEILKRMYLQWASSMGFKAKVVDEAAHEEAGIKSCTVEVYGQYAYGYLKAEIGVHRLVRISPFDSNARRHTAFASVAAYPQIDDNIEIDIVESDLRIDTYRASGAGGQHVNTTDSAVRITHMPTNIVVQCQNERSQHQNKDRCMQMLSSRLLDLQRKQREQDLASISGENQNVGFGSQIRSYVMQPYQMVKDLRTNFEVGAVDSVLNGEIDGFVEAYLRWLRSGKPEL